METVHVILHPRSAQDSTWHLGTGQMIRSHSESPPRGWGSLPFSSDRRCRFGHVCQRHCDWWFSPADLTGYPIQIFLETLSQAVQPTSLDESNSSNFCHWAAAEPPVSVVALEFLVPNGIQAQRSAHVRSDGSCPTWTCPLCAEARIKTVKANRHTHRPLRLGRNLSMQADADLLDTSRGAH